MAISEPYATRSGMLRVLVAGLAVSSMLFGTWATQAAPATAASSGAGPKVVYGSKAGPVKIPVKLKTVASMTLPKGGWFITAKALLVGVGGSPAGHLGVQCRLTLGSRTDSVSATPVWQQRDGSHVPVLLTLAGRLSSPAKARLRCVGEEGGQVVIRSIRMTAMKTGRLTTRQTTSPSKTTGSGAPVVVSSSSKAPKAVVGDGAYHQVSKLPVGPGAWWIVAKAVASNGNTTDDAACRLRAGGDFDLTQFGMSAQGYAGDSVPIGLQVVHAFGAPGLAVLTCKAPYGFKIRDVVITAIKAGRLTNRNTDGGSTWTVGKGSPRIISGWSDGPTAIPVGTYETVSSMVLPRGNWMVLAKEWFGAEGVPSDAVARRTQCQLVIIGTTDGSTIQYGNNVTRVAPMFHSMVQGDDGPFGVKVRCRRTAAGGSGDVHFVKMTALRLGSITYRKL